MPKQATDTAEGESVGKPKSRVQFESDDESTSDDEDDNASGADRELRKQHAEEIEKYIDWERSNLTRLFSEFPDGTKLTRKKARELDHDIISILQLGGIQTEETSSVLAQQFDDDEEDDEEYEPEDDDHSDELSTTCSDIDSQPRTPGEALTQEDAAISTQYDEEEGVFKVPGEPPKTPSQSKVDETISRRTRSKISLTATPLEAFEGQCLDPDASADNYDTYTDPDESWQEFLKEFQQPLNTLNEEEEETDPEYVASGREVGDVEEVEDIPITRDEVHDLLDELLDGFQVGYEYEDNYEVDGCHHDSQHMASSEPDPNNPFNVTTSNIQPVAVIHTNPSLAPKYEMVLGADNKLYVLPRADLRALLPGVSLRKSETPITSPRITVDITGDLEDLLEDIGEYKDAYREMIVKRHRELFSDNQLKRLQIQMLKHVQLLGQCFVQSHGHPERWSCADFFLKKLKNFVFRSRKSPTLQNLCWNLGDMYALCLNWKKELSVDSDENREYVQWLTDNKSKHYVFHPRVMECLVTSKAFIFSELLPRNPINTRKRVAIGEGELHLMLSSFARLTEQNPKMKPWTCIKIFVKHFCPWRPPISVQGWFKKGRTSQLMADYKKSRFVPEVVPETMDIVCYSEVQEPAQRPRGSLPKSWNTYVFSNERILRVYHDLVQPHKAKKKKTVPVKTVDETPRLQATENTPLVTFEYSTFKAQFNLPADNQTFLTRSITQQGRSARHKPASRRSRETFELIQRLVKNTPKRCTSLEAIRTRKRLTWKLHRTLEAFQEGCNAGLRSRSQCLIATKIFDYLKEFDVFARLLDVGMKEATTPTPPDGLKRTGGMADEVPGPTPKRVKLDEEALLAKRTLEMTKKYQKAQRVHENNRLLLQPESETVGKERDSMFSWNYFYKVQSTYLSEGRPEKIQEFVTILKNFKPKDTVPVLFNKMEKLFLPDHRELLEVFLSMLLPGHAAQLGKFFEHSVLANMQTLIAKLRIYFDKQPNQWKKIMNVLNELDAEQGVSMATIKQRFLPLLKGNPLLIDWFMQLFPTERPPEPQESEFEEMQTKNDVPFEVIPGSLIQADSPDLPSCAIKYLQGKIQYGNRYILPADLSFLATSYELTGKAPRTVVPVEKPAPKKAKRGAGKKQDEEKAASPTKPVGCIHAVAVSPMWEENENISGTCSANNSGASKEEPLCDAVTLRAHMIRLNPPAAVDGGGAGSNSAADVSPKKTQDWKTVPINSRRTTKPMSPKKSSNAGSPKKGAAETKRKRQAASSVSVKVEATHVVDVAGTPESIEWTREEDKIILEAVNGQKDTAEGEILDQLCAVISGRSREEISTRFQFIINVLKQFA